MRRYLRRFREHRYDLHVTHPVETPGDGLALARRVVETLAELGTPAGFRVDIGTTCAEHGGGVAVNEVKVRVRLPNDHAAAELLDRLGGNLCEHARFRIIRTADAREAARREAAAHG